MPATIQVLNPRALLVPDVALMLKRAVNSLDIIAPGGIDSVAEDFYNHVTDPNLFMFIGMEDGAAKAVTLGNFPTSYLFPYPIVSLIYNEGSREMLRMISEATAGHIMAHGYSTAWAFNGSKHSDEVWLRGLIPSGLKGKKIASVMEINVE